MSLTDNVKKIQITNEVKPIGADSENISVYRKNGEIMENYQPPAEGEEAPSEESAATTLKNIEANMMRTDTYANEGNIIKVERGGTGVTTLAAAREAMGLGNATTALAKEFGGTGTTDGTLNGVTLATNTVTVEGVTTTQYGYRVGNNFHSFRQPTGNATAADVLSGKTFANASNDSISGGMNDYSGDRRRTVTPSEGTGNEILNLDAGYHNSIIVNRTTVFDKAFRGGYTAGESAGKTAGDTAAHNNTWTVDIPFVIRATGNWYNAAAWQIIPCFNVTDIKLYFTNTPSGNIGWPEQSSLQNLGYAYTNTLTLEQGLLMTDKPDKNNNPGYTWMRGTYGTTTGPYQFPAPTGKFFIIRECDVSWGFRGYFRVTYQDKHLR